MVGTCLLLDVEGMFAKGYCSTTTNDVVSIVINRASMSQ